MFPSKTISIRDDHHYVDMNPRKTAEDIKLYFVDEKTGEKKIIKTVGW